MIMDYRSMIAAPVRGVANIQHLRVMIVVLDIYLGRKARVVDMV